MVSDSLLKPENEKQIDSRTGVIDVVDIDHPHWNRALVVAPFFHPGIAQDPVLEAFCVFVEFNVVIEPHKGSESEDPEEYRQE